MKKALFVTGGTVGTGLCIAETFAKAGYAVFITSREREKAEEAAGKLAKDYGVRINQLPVVGCAPEWMSEKAVSIGNYVIGTGIDTFLGVDPYISGSSEMKEIITGGTRQWCDAAFTIETDIEKLTDLIIDAIEDKRTALGI